jgi:hypothetical protein
MNSHSSRLELSILLDDLAVAHWNSIIVVSHENLKLCYNLHTKICVVLGIDSQ